MANKRNKNIEPTDSTNDFFPELEKFGELFRDYFERERVLSRIKQPIHTTPVYTLPEILSSRTKDELKFYANFWRIKYTSQWKKDDFIQELLEIMLIPENFLLLFRIAADTDIDLFLQIASKEYILGEENFFHQSGLKSSVFQNSGCVHAFSVGSGGHMTLVPTEIRNMVLDLEKSGKINQTIKEELILNFICSSIHLYGLISLHDFVKLFSQLTTFETTRDELLIVSTTHNKRFEHVYFYSDGYFLDPYFQSDEIGETTDKIKKIKSFSIRKDRFLPELSEFILYKDMDHLLPDPEYDNLQEFLKSEINLDEKNLEMIDHFIHDAAKLVSPSQEFWKIIENSFHGDIPKNLFKKRKKLNALASEIIKKYRHWNLNGYTPHELADDPEYLKLPGFFYFSKDEIDEKNSTQFTNDHLFIADEEDILFQEEISSPRSMDFQSGRNDPCPCGSGKKYKKCCGR